MDVITEPFEDGVMVKLRQPGPRAAARVGLFDESAARRAMKLSQMLKATTRGE